MLRPSKKGEQKMKDPRKIDFTLGLKAMDAKWATGETFVLRVTPASSNVHSWFYWDGDLRVVFRGGDAYDYKNVPHEVVKEFAQCVDKGESAGKFLNARIKKVYEYEKVI